MQTDEPAGAQSVTAAPGPSRRPLPRRHRWMLLLAFEVLVYGFSQAAFQPVRTAGITVEMPIRPGHVVT